MFIDFTFHLNPSPVGAACLCCIAVNRTNENLQMIPPLRGCSKNRIGWFYKYGVPTELFLPFAVQPGRYRSRY